MFLRKTSHFLDLKIVKTQININKEVNNIKIQSNNQTVIDNQMGFKI